MSILRLPFKLLALPLVAATSLLQWMGILLVSVSSTLINMLLGVVSMIVMASWMFGLTSAGNMTCGLTLCLILFILPHIAQWLLIRLAVLNSVLKEFVRS